MTFTPAGTVASVWPRNRVATVGLAKTPERDAIFNGSIFRALNRRVASARRLRVLGIVFIGKFAA